MKGNVSAPFTTGSSAPESRPDGWRDEGEKEKKEAYRERRLNPLRYHLSLGRPSAALELSAQMYVKEHSHDIQSSEGFWMLLVE